MNKPVKKLVLLQGVLLCAASVAHAHGPSEFLSLDSYYQSNRGDKLFYTHYDYMVRDKNDPKSDRWEITPGISYTIIDNLTFDVHTHFAKFGVNHLVDERQEEFDPSGPSPFMEAAAFSLNYALPKNEYLDIAFTATYELPFERAEELLGSESVVAGTLILGKYFATHSNFTVNINVEVEDGESEFSWGAGVKTPLTQDPHGIAVGLEVFDSFDGGDFSILPAAFVPVGSGNSFFKFGIELGEDTLDFKSAFYYSF